MSIAPSPRNGTSAEISKTLLILRFLATGVEETNEFDFEEAGFSIISSCRLEVSAKGLRLFFPLIYIKKTPSVVSIIIGGNEIKNNTFALAPSARMAILEVMIMWGFRGTICPNTKYYLVYFYQKEGT